MIIRIWSLHPKYLDTKGLVALWRESLLAKKVLEGNTRGYKNHSQLIRFKDNPDPIKAINFYLSYVLEEAIVRGYVFNREKVSWEKCIGPCPLLPVTVGQLRFERNHLIEKLRIRDERKLQELLLVTAPEPHPLFKTVVGEVEDWEIVKD